ncbi:MAG: alginate lyase family protein, partial [Bacteroidales bacterium]|nr:alginate lyase family protein [Bacteroidales bacterium]
MKETLGKLLSAVLCVLALITSSCNTKDSVKDSGFVHPGIDLTLADLDWVKAMVLAGEEPWAGYAVELKKGLLDFVPQPSSRVIRGAYGSIDIGSSQWGASSGRVYACAVLWYITGEEAYAKKAIEIIDAWSRKLRSFDENDTKLIIGLDGQAFCNAAEILRYTYPGWTEEDTESVNTLLMEILFPYIRYYSS